MPSKKSSVKKKSHPFEWHTTNGEIGWLLEPVNPILAAVINETEGPLLSAAIFKEHWLKGQSYALKKGKMVPVVRAAAIILEFLYNNIYALEPFSDRLLTIIVAINFKDHDYFFKVLDEIAAYSEKMIEFFDGSINRNAPWVQQTVAITRTFKAKAEQLKIERQTQIEETERQRVKKQAEAQAWRAGLCERFLEQHRPLLLTFLRALTPSSTSSIPPPSIIIAKGLEIYFPGLGKDVDIYIGISEALSTTEKARVQHTSQFVEALKTAGFIVTGYEAGLVMRSGQSFWGQFQAKHPDHPVPMDISIHTLPAKPTEAAKILKPEWVFDIASGYVALQLNGTDKIDISLMQTPLGLREHWLESSVTTPLVIRSIKRGALDINELAFLIKTCCKLQIDLQTGITPHPVLLGGDREALIQLDPSLLKRIRELEKNPAEFSRVFFKILGSYFSSRPRELHEFLLKNHWLSILFQEMAPAFEAPSGLDLLLKNELFGFSYFVFLFFKTLQKIEPSLSNSEMEEKFHDYLHRHFSYERPDLLLIFRSLLEGKIVKEIAKDSYVEKACRCLLLTTLDTKAAPFVPRAAATKSSCALFSPSGAQARPMTIYNKVTWRTRTSKKSQKPHDKTPPSGPQP